MNNIIVGEREIGKTTYLLNFANNKVENGCKIAILDSATEHKRKSLILKFMKGKENCYLLCPKDKNDIVPLSSNNYYQKCLNSKLFSRMVSNIKKILCVDLSYFLELAYTYKEKYKSQELYDFNRQLYTALSQQVATCLMALVKEGYLSRLTVVTDEIEFPVSQIDISQFQEEDKIHFLSAVHEEDSKGSFYKTFIPANFTPYLLGKKNENC